MEHLRLPLRPCLPVSMPALQGLLHATRKCCTSWICFLSVQSQGSWRCLPGCLSCQLSSRSRSGLIFMSTACRPLIGALRDLTVLRRHPSWVSRLLLALCMPPPSSSASSTASLYSPLWPRSVVSCTASVPRACIPSSPGWLAWCDRTLLSIVHRLLIL